MPAITLMKSLFLLLFLFIPSSGAMPLPEYCPKKMTVVFYGDWFPYMFYENKRYQGIDFDFMSLVLDRLGCEFDINALPEKRAHKGLASGDSLIMSGATITEERKQYAYFSKPYRGETLSLFYLDDKGRNINTADQVINQSEIIAINGAAYYGPYIHKKRNSSQSKKFIHVPSIEKRIEMITRQRAQAMVEDHIAGCFYLHKSSSSVAKKTRWIQVSQENVAFMFSKGVVPYEFVAIFNQTMQQLIAQGAYSQIAAKYTPQGC